MAKHTFEILLEGEGEKIVLGSFKDLVSVKIDNASRTRFKGSLGMMGNADTGALLAHQFHPYNCIVIYFLENQYFERI